MKTSDGTVIGTCNLRQYHLGKCHEVYWEIAGDWNSFDPTPRKLADMDIPSDWTTIRIPAPK